MKTKHTPGPWMSRLVGGNNWHVVADSPNVKGLAQTVCDINGPWNPSNYAANAKLIAACPDLLAACQALIDAYRIGERNGGSVDWSDLDAAHSLAKGAMRKAK